MIADRILPPRVVDPGLFEGTIFLADLASYEWRVSHHNPTGTVLRVGVEIEDSQGKAHVFDALDVSSYRRIVGLFRSAGLAPPEGHLAEEIAALIGKQVEITTKVISPKLGRNAAKEKSVVGEWLAPGSSRVV
jgi:hypothetical protein